MALAVSLSPQPSQPPERKGGAKGEGTQISKQTDRAKHDDNHAANAPPAPSNTVVYNEQRRPPGHNTDTAQANETAQVEGRITTFTGLLVVVGFLQVGVLLMQWWMIRRQNEHFSNADRAWIQITEVLLVQKFSFVTPSPNQFFFWLRPYIVNKGRTHARVIRVIARKELLDKVDPSDSPRPPRLPEHPQFSPSDTLVERHIMLSPKQGINWVTIWITRDEVERIKSRDAFLYIYGRVDYIDISGHERHSGFCRVYWIPPGPNDPNFGYEDFVESEVIPRAYTECT